MLAEVVQVDNEEELLDAIYDEVDHRFSALYIVDNPEGGLDRVASEWDLEGWTARLVAAFENWNTGNIVNQWMIIRDE